MAAPIIKSHSLVNVERYSLKVQKILLSIEGGSIEDLGEALSQVESYLVDEGIWYFYWHSMKTRIPNIHELEEWGEVIHKVHIEIKKYLSDNKEPEIHNAINISDRASILFNYHTNVLEKTRRTIDELHKNRDADTAAPELETPQPADPQPATPAAEKPFARPSVGDEFMVAATQDAACAMLADLRQAEEISQSEVGRRTGWGQGNVGRFERATNDPRLSRILEYCDAVGYDVELKFTKREPKP